MEIAFVDQSLYYCYPTVIDDYTQCPISGHACDTLGIHQISEDIMSPVRRFHCQVNHGKHHGEHCL